MEPHNKSGEPQFIPSTQPVPIPMLEEEEFFLQLLFPGPS